MALNDELVDVVSALAGDKITAHFRELARNWVQTRSRRLRGAEAYRFRKAGGQ